MSFEVLPGAPSFRRFSRTPVKGSPVFTAPLRRWARLSLEKDLKRASLVDMVNGLEGSRRRLAI